MAILVVTRLSAALIVAASFMALFSGCEQSRLPGLVSVSGTVSYKGQLVEGAWVTFVPSQKGNGQRAASGITNGQGRFKMTTLDPDDGVMPGEYQVKISKRVDATNNSAKDIAMGKIKSKSDTQHIEYLIPKVYENPAESGLSVTIEDQAQQSVDFDLE